MKTQNKKLYALNSAQEVAKLQCSFSLYKRVINITMSATSEDKIDFSIMKTAINETIKRNDCLRLRFCKTKNRIMQYFLDEWTIADIPYIKFESKEEQENFIKKETSMAIKYMKGEVFKPFFCNTYNNKDMILVKVCHLNFDIYGLNIFFKDLFGVYNALKNNTPFPECPTKYEDVLIKDLAVKENKEAKKRNRDFFYDMFKNKEEPFYAGIHGDNNKLWRKYSSKGKHYMKLFFVQNDTKGYMKIIPAEIVNPIMEFCKQNGISPSNYLFYACSVVLSKINHDTKNMLPLELCNCRGTLTEKNCAGTKSQSLKGCYTTVEPEKSFIENLSVFCENQTKLFKYINFSDIQITRLMKQIYNEPVFATYYSLTFSFIPYQKPDNITFDLYSNGKCALPAYVALMYDINKEDIQMAYDCQTKIITEEDVNSFHQNYLNLLKQVLANKNILIKDIIL